MVVDKTDAGLLVSFGIPDRTPELQPFEKVLLLPPVRPNVNYENEDVLFLHRLSSGHSWKWLGGKAIAGNSHRHSFVVVDFVYENVHIRDIFRTERVRSLSDILQHGIDPEYFKKSRVRLPWTDGMVRDYKINNNKEFIDIEHTFSKVQHILPVDVDLSENELVFIYSSKEYSERSALQFCRVGLAIPCRPSVNLEKDGLVAFDTAVVTKCDNNKMQTTVAEDYSITDLPYDVILELFQMTLCHQRALLRHVCSAWKDIFQSPACSTIVPVDVRITGNRGWRFGACLFRCLTPFTRFLVLIGDSDPFDSGKFFGSRELDLIRQMVNVAGAHLSAFMLVEIPLRSAFLTEESNFALCNKFRLFCDRLIVYAVTVQNLLGHHFNWLPGKRTTTNYQDLEVGCYAFETKKQHDVRDIFDKNCPEIMDADLNRVASRIRSAHLAVVDEQPNEWLGAAFTEIIRKWQYGDTRFGPDCSWADIKAAQLDKAENLCSLRKCTLAVLVNMVDRFFPLDS